MPKLYRTSHSDGEGNTVKKLLWKDHKLMTECCCNEEAPCAFTPLEVNPKALVRVSWTENENFTESVRFGGHQFSNGETYCVRLARTVYGNCTGDYPRPAGEMLDSGGEDTYYTCSAGCHLEARAGGIVDCWDMGEGESYCYENPLNGWIRTRYYGIYQTLNFGSDGCTGAIGESWQEDGIYTSHPDTFYYSGGNLAFNAARVPNTAFTATQIFTVIGGAEITINYEVLGIYRSPYEVN